MLIRTILWSMLVILTVTGCSPADQTPGVDCSPIDAGALNFAENTKAWFPYAGPEVLVFKNEAGDTIRFRRNEPFDSIFTFRYDEDYHLARVGCPDSLRVRYNYPTKIGLFESDSLDFFIYADIRVAPIPGLFPPAFYEGLRVQVGEYTGSSSSRTLAELLFVTDNGEVLCPAFPAACPEYEELESVSLLGETYENTYFKADGALYYHRTIGVLGFADGQAGFWGLVGVE